MELNLLLYRNELKKKTVYNYIFYGIIIGLVEDKTINRDELLKLYIDTLITGHKEILTKISQYMDNRPKEIEKEVEEAKKTDTIKKSVNDDFEDDFVDKKKGDFEYGR